MESRETDTQAGLKLLHDEVNQPQIVVTEHRKPWYLEASTLTSALAVAISGISFFISTQQGNQQELRAKREEFRGVLEKLISMSEEDNKLRYGDRNQQEFQHRIGYLGATRKLYLSSADMLAKDLGDHVLFAEYTILGNEFGLSNDQQKAIDYYRKSVQTAASPLQRAQGYISLAQEHVRRPLRNAKEMRKYYTLAVEQFNNENTDFMKFMKGDTYEVWADTEFSVNATTEGQQKLELARQSYIKMSDDDPNKAIALRQLTGPLGDSTSQPFSNLPPSPDSQGPRTQQNDSFSILKSTIR